jgi:hypothetical protein
MRKRGLVAVGTLIFLTSLILTACALGNPEDLRWKEKIVAAPYQQVYRTIYDKVPCTGYTPRGNLYTDIQEGSMILFLSGMVGIKEYAMVTVKGLPDGTTQVRAGVLPWLPRLDSTLLRLTDDDVRCR